MCGPQQLRIHVPQQCSTISEGSDFSTSRATNTKNAKETKNPRKKKIQRQNHETTSATKKTQVSDSPLQMTNAAFISLSRCLFLGVLRDYCDLCSKNFLQVVMFPIATNILFFMPILFSCTYRHTSHSCCLRLAIRV